MVNNSGSKYLISIVIAVISLMAVICAAVIIFAPEVLPMILQPTPTIIQPTSSPSNGYQPEIIPPLTFTPAPTETATVTPTFTPGPTSTPFVLPTIAFEGLPLPDLIVAGISDPVCATEYEGTKLRFNVYVRNIGQARTRPFGVFDTGVFLILGQRHYSLDEWDAEFKGVVGSSVTEVYNLNPGQDIKFTVVIDLLGNKDFGIEVVANSGESPIRESDMTNNTLVEYHSVRCY